MKANKFDFERAPIIHEISASRAPLIYFNNLITFACEKRNVSPSVEVTLISATSPRNRENATEGERKERWKNNELSSLIIIRTSSGGIRAADFSHFEPKNFAYSNLPGPISAG